MSYRSLAWLLRHSSDICILRQQPFSARALKVVACRAYGTDSDGKKPFESLLNDKNIQNPFIDPSRNKKKITERHELGTEGVADLKDEKVGKVPSGEKAKAEESKDYEATDGNKTERKNVEVESVNASRFTEKAFTSSSAENNKENKVEKFEFQIKRADTKKNGFLKNLSKKLGLHIDENATEEEKKRLKMARYTKVGSFILFVSSSLGLIAFCLYYGRRKRDEQGNYVDDEFTGSMLAPLHRILKSFKEWRDYVTEPSREVLLPDPLPEQIQPKYTLVIEMKHILLAPEWTYKDGHRFKKRPALEYFLEMVGYPNFEVVIYTSETALNANAVIDSFDPKQRIMYRLYRDCTKYVKGHHIKDLSRLNRDLSKVIYIDYDPESFKLNPENVLRLPKWDGDMNDTSLVDLAELLKTIYLSNVEDVRPTLQYYSQFDDPLKEFRQRAVYLAEQERVQKERLAEDDNSVLKRYSGRLFGYSRHP